MIRLIPKFNTKHLAVFFNRGTGPSHDSRLRKIISTLSSNGLASQAMLWTKSNRYSKHYYGSGSYAFTLPLLLASKHPIRGPMLINAMEILQETVSGFLFLFYRRPKYVVVQNHRHFLLVFLAILFYRTFFKSRVIWDLRELPNGFLKGKCRILFLNFLFRRCDSILVANESRLDYMVTLYGQRNLMHARVLSNFENESFLTAQSNPLPASILSFLSGRRYIYLQNPIDLDRGIVETLALISKNKDFCVLVSGKVPNSITEYVTSLYGYSFIESNVFYTGWVDDISLVSFIDNAFASVVIYKYLKHSSDYHSLNNRFAASNTLYQSLSRGTPVIVGCNEGMSRIVNELGVGIVMNDDGSTDEVISSFEKLKLDYAEIKDACVSKKDALTWEAQEQSLVAAVFG